jgi:hypothetical protein
VSKTFPTVSKHYPSSVLLKLDVMISYNLLLEATGG